MAMVGTQGIGKQQGDGKQEGMIGIVAWKAAMYGRHTGLWQTMRVLPAAMWYGRQLGVATPHLH